MSHYITFRFAEKTLCCFPSVSKLYEFFFEGNAVTNSWTPVYPSLLSSIYDDISEDIANQRRLVNTYKRMMNARSISYNKLFETASSIQTTLADIKELEQTLHYIELFLMIASENAECFEWWIQ